MMRAQAVRSVARAFPTQSARISVPVSSFPMLTSYAPEYVCRKPNCSMHEHM